MLKDRVVATIKFFDFQAWPLTLLELQNFLIQGWSGLKTSVDLQGEILAPAAPFKPEPVSIDAILYCLEHECREVVENTLGFYHLSGRSKLAQMRLDGYFYGINREKLIKKYIPGLKFLPFVRAAALAGSQAMGQQKMGSDIDLLIITDPEFMWLARTIVTAYFQLLGLRRHKNKIRNRFCLNHYLAGPKKITQLRNLYTAMEYIKLRPLVGSNSIASFQKLNMEWLKFFFPNFLISQPEKEKPAAVQEFLENCLHNNFGLWLEKTFKSWQLKRIHQEKFIVVETDELSFHPDSKQQELLVNFFHFQEQQQRVTVKSVG